MKTEIDDQAEYKQNGFLNDFVSRFWEARKLTQKSLLNRSEIAYSKLAEEARIKGFNTEAYIADAAVLELKGKYDEAIRCLNQVIDDSGCKIKGVAYFLLGSVYKERYQNEFKNAIESYENAIKDKQFDKPAWANNNLGNIYFRLACLEVKPDGQFRADEHFKKASEYYEKSLEYKDEQSDTQYITHYNQGRLFLELKDYTKAIQKFDDSLSSAGDNYDMQGSCYREMGTAHIIVAMDENGKTFHDAISCWENARDIFDEADVNAGEDVNNTGKSAVVLAKIRVARQFRDKLKTLQPGSDDEVLLRWWPQEESGADGYSTPEERIFSMIEATGRDRYQLYNSRPSSRFSAQIKGQVEIPSKNVLAIMRGWGSASPLIEDAYSACVGGGYFLKWRDKGLVIDPGIDFMRNFRSNGFHMREVDGIVVSHDHTDHNADLRSIDDVFYEMYRRSDEDEPGKGERNWHYYLICDRRTKTKDFLREQAKHRSIIPMVSKSSKEEKKEVPINLRDKGLPFIVHYIRAEHGKIDAFCLRVDCLNSDGTTPIKIGFTCDTQYDVSLDSFLKECDILVAHISQPSLAELLDSDILKKKHLGYRGVAKLIKKVKPKLAILGEFWAGFADMRIDITKGLKRICNTEPPVPIIPSSVGLFISPTKDFPEIECTNCHKWRPASSIYVGASTHEFGSLSYLCPLCRI
ncbi:MBL fold metallo-hydrolase [Rufibacter hautae]|uniref:Tetratricopeptide repeat protein n=1 Tax=Rufibacter hautae TaxID=2595005 RepID=A0A5B6TEV2_9BACT|nr:MBL fold metallo-hydrolase [Rufibacter hautae]KAA3437712.1 tetratricopeptide repeat protein [Rufibacter hautae]